MPLGDQFVLQVLQHGWRIPILHSHPSCRLTSRPPSHTVQPDRLPLLWENVNILIEKNAIREIDPIVHGPGLYSDVFLVPKKNSNKMRMIHNLARVNRDCIEDPPKFSLNHLGVIRPLIKPNAWMTSLDLSDAYLHVPIAPDHWKFLRFQLEDRHFEWMVLPFGISWAPWLFTRLTNPVAAFLHKRSISISFYLDDAIMFAEEKPQLLLDVQFTLRCLHQLGWLVNEQKSELVPTRRLKYLGAIIDTSIPAMYIPQDRLLTAQSAVRALLQRPASLHQWQVLLGLLTSLQDLTIRGRLMLRPLQVHVAHFLHLEPKQAIPLPETLRQHLQWWLQDKNVSTGSSLLPFETQTELFVDASLQGWGAHLLDQTAAGVWSDEQADLHINVLEFTAIVLAIRHWQHRLQNARLMIVSDNLPTVWVINRQGSTRSPPLLQLAFQFFQLIDSLNVTVRARHIPGAKNVLADSLSRQSKPAPTEWQLHPDAFQIICQRLGQPNVDLFATRFNNQLPVFVSPVPDQQALKHDALAMSWEGLSRYAFPPPILIPRVLQKITTTRNLRLILVAPWWPTRLWFADLQQLTEDQPVVLPAWRNILRHPQTGLLHPNPEVWALHAWTISRGRC